MTARAVQRSKQSLAVQDRWVIVVAADRYSQILRVKGDEIEQLRAQLEIAVALGIAVGGVKAERLRVGAIARRQGKQRI